MCSPSLSLPSMPPHCTCPLDLLHFQNMLPQMLSPKCGQVMSCQVGLSALAAPPNSCHGDLLIERYGECQISSIHILRLRDRGELTVTLGIDIRTMSNLILHFWNDNGSERV